MFSYADTTRSQMLVPLRRSLYSTISHQLSGVPLGFRLFGIGTFGHSWKLAQNLKHMTAKHDCKYNLVLLWFHVKVLKMHIPCMRSFQPAFWSHRAFVACCLFLHKCIYGHHCPPIGQSIHGLAILSALLHAHVTFTFFGSSLGSSHFKNWWFHVPSNTHLEVLFLRVPLFNLDLRQRSMRGLHWHWVSPARVFGAEKSTGYRIYIKYWQPGEQLHHGYWPFLTPCPVKTIMQLESHCW